MILSTLNIKSTTWVINLRTRLTINLPRSIHNTKIRTRMKKWNRFNSNDKYNQILVSNPIACKNLSIHQVGLFKFKTCNKIKMDRFSFQNNYRWSSLFKVIRANSKLNNKYQMNKMMSCIHKAISLLNNTKIALTWVIVIFQYKVCPIQ